MRKTGTVLIDNTNVVVQHLGVEPGLIRLPEGVEVHGLKAGEAVGRYRLLERFEDDTSAPVNHKRTGQTEAFDGTKFVVTPTYAPLSREEVRDRIRERMQRLFRAEETERNETQFGLYRDLVRVRRTLMIDAYRDGKPVDIETGAIDYAGSWPA